MKDRQGWMIVVGWTCQMKQINGYWSNGWVVLAMNKDENLVHVSKEDDSRWMFPEDLLMDDQAFEDDLVF